MTDRPTVLFCVGAAKAGTTWLYNQLFAHPDCHLRTIKELHYFGSLESGHFGHQLKALRGKMAILKRRADGAGRERKLADLEEWIAVLRQRREDIPGYLSYLTGGRGSCRLVADMTPAYGLLPEQRLRAMAGIAPDVRFLFLLRDPVARLWSHVRMIARRESTAAEFPGAASRLMEQVLDGAPSGAVERGDYAGILTRLMAAVDPSRLMIQFQEDMISRSGFARLCAFLGIAPAEADFERRVHQGAALPLNAAQARRAREFLRPQYEFVGRLLGDLPPAWQARTGVIA